MEILYDQIIESFIEFKSKIHELNIRFIQRLASNDYIYNHEIRSSLNRLCFNILSISKLYLDKHCFDKTKQSHILKVTGCNIKHEEIVTHRSNAFETNKEYVLGCELRNSAQHQILPIDNFNTGISHQPNSAQAISRLTAPMDKIKLASSNVDKKIIEKFDNDPDLHVVLDRYVYAIGTFHEKKQNVSERCHSQCI